jgi:hypothetical protein
MNNDDDTIDEVEDDRLLRCRSSSGDGDAVFTPAYYYPYSFSQNHHFQADNSFQAIPYRQSLRGIRGLTYSTENP